MTNYQQRLQRELEAEAKRLDRLYARMHHYQRQIQVARQKIQQMETNQVDGKLIPPPLEVGTARSADSDN